MLIVAALSAVVWAGVFVVIALDDHKLGDRWVQQMRSEPRRKRWDSGWARTGYKVGKASLTAVVALAVLVPLGTQADAVEKRFSVKCVSSHARRVDPIVSPRRRASHMHLFFGNRNTNRHSRYPRMIKRGTSCQLKADKAAYWVPTLMRKGSHAPIRATHMLAYYRSTGALGNMNVQPFPRNLRMVSFDTEWMCLDRETFNHKPDCSPGETVGLRVLFPSCWDGRRRDSWNHIAHMAEQTGGGCPKSHPVPVPKLAMNVRYPINDARRTMLSAQMKGMAPHGDFWNTWNQGALRRLTDRCLGRGVTKLCALQTKGNNEL